MKDLDGAGFPSDWSSNGRYVAYSSYLGRGGSGIYIVPIQSGEAGKPWEYLDTEHDEAGAVFSPAHGNSDPKWIAYTSDESGRNEVYVQSLPRDNFKVQISSAGGSHVQWRRDAKELYYLEPNGDLMAVDTKVFPKLEAGLPRRLFHMDYPVASTTPSLNYAPARDGQRFLVSRPIAGLGYSISVVTNWATTAPLR